MIYRSLWQTILLTILSLGACNTLAADFSAYNSTFSLEVEKISGKIFICSSVAINQKTLLTAAHCLEEAKNIQITDGHIKRTAKSWGTHPQYNKLDSKYFADIGIITLSKILPKNLNYPRLTEPLPYYSLTRIGFGRREGKNLRTLVSGIWISEEIDSTLILKDALGVPGDSGGPLFQFINGKLGLVAIHSTVEGMKSYAPIVPRLILESFYSLPR